MDGVIFDTETVGLRAWLAVGKRHGFEDVEPYARECIGRSTKDSMAIMQNAFPQADILSLKDECIAEFKKIIMTEGLQLKKGAAELLQWLDDNNIKTAIASSTEQHGVMSHLKAAGIDKYFGTVIGGDMVTNSKPEPEIYLKACAALDEAPSRCFAIEDSNNGIISAHSAGMRAILIPDIVENTPEVKAMAEKQFIDLLEVKQYLEQQLTSA